MTSKHHRIAYGVTTAILALVLTPLVFAAVALASWALRPAGRALAPAGSRA